MLSWLPSKELRLNRNLTSFNWIIIKLVTTGHGHRYKVRRAEANSYTARFDGKIKEKLKSKLLN